MVMFVEDFNQADVEQDENLDNIDNNFDLNGGRDSPDGDRSVSHMTMSDRVQHLLNTSHQKQKIIT
jgi:hypothetical protein